MSDEHRAHLIGGRLDGYTTPIDFPMPRLVIPLGETEAYVVDEDGPPAVRHKQLEYVRVTPAGVGVTDWVYVPKDAAA